MLLGLHKNKTLSDDRFERVAQDTDLACSRIHDFMETLNLQIEEDLFSKLLLKYLGNLNSIDPPPQPVKLSRSCRYKTFSTEFQQFLSQVLQPKSFVGLESLSDPEDFILEDILEVIKQQKDKLIQDGLGDLESAFLEARYYITPANSDLLKKIRREAIRNCAESSVADLSLAHKASFGSITSELEVTGDIQVLSLGKRNISGTPEKRDREEFLIHSSSYIHSTQQSSPLLEFLTILQEVTAVYLEGVNILLDSQKGDLGRLAVYCLLVTTSHPVAKIR